MAEQYEIRRFKPAAKEDPAYPESVTWMRAVAFGFHDARRSDERVDKGLEMQRADGRPTCAPRTKSWRVRVPRPPDLSSSRLTY